MLEICMYACKRKRVKDFDEIRLSCKSLFLLDTFSLCYLYPSPQTKVGWKLAVLLQGFVVCFATTTRAITAVWCRFLYWFEKTRSFSKILNYLVVRLKKSKRKRRFWIIQNKWLLCLPFGLISQLVTAFACNTEYNKMFLERKDGIIRVRIFAKVEYKCISLERYQVLLARPAKAGT